MLWRTLDLRTIAVLYCRHWTSGNQRVKIVSRPRADLRISLKERGGQTYRIELIRVPFTRRFRVRRNGKKSRKLPEATATEVADEIRRWLARSAARPTTAEDILRRS